MTRPSSAKPAQPVAETATSEALRRARHMAARMLRDGLTARTSPFEPAKALLVRGGGSVALGAGTADLDVLQLAVREGLLVESAKGRFRPKQPGAGSTADHKASQAITHEIRQGPDGNAVPMAVNLRESPLVWLRRHKGPTGQPLIDDAGFAAGERFRADVTRASLLPGVTMDWSRFGSSADKVGATRQDPHDTTLAARERVHHAMDALGPELAGFVLDTCGFLISLQDAERQRGWPVRSGKLALRIALSHLARHYGMNASTAPARTARNWHTPDARPDMSRWL